MGFFDKAQLGASDKDIESAIIKAGAGTAVVLPDHGLPSYPDIINQQLNLDNKEDIRNKVTSLSDESTDIQYPSAKCVYDALLTKIDRLVGATLNDLVVLTADGQLEDAGIGVNDLVAATTYDTDQQLVNTRLGDIEELIPEAATASNQLADKAFVNSSIATSTAVFRGTYNSVEELDQVTADANDYAFVVRIDASGNTLYDRYKYNGTAWVFEYTLNNSSFTQAQWNAINSGITSQEVTRLSSIATGAQVNVIESISLNGSPLTITNKAVDIAVHNGWTYIPSIDTQGEITWTSQILGNNEEPATVTPRNITGPSAVEISETEPVNQNVRVWIDPSGSNDSFPTKQDVAEIVYNHSDTDVTLTAQHNTNYIYNELVALEIGVPTGLTYRDLYWSNVAFSSGAAPTAFTMNPGLYAMLIEGKSVTNNVFTPESDTIYSISMRWNGKFIETEIKGI